MSKYLTVKQAAEYLKVTPMTIHRWADQGKLKAVETAGGLRIKTDSVEERKKWMRRIRYDGLVFTFPVLIPYQQARQKYEITTKDKGDVGWISLNPDYLKGLSKKELARQYFKPIKYHRVYLEGKYPIIVVSERDFDRLPKAEQAQWKRFEMKRKRILEEIGR